MLSEEMAKPIETNRNAKSQQTDRIFLKNGKFRTEKILKNHWKCSKMEIREKNKKTWKLSIDAFQSIALVRGETCKEKIKNFKIFVDNIKNSNI